MNKNDVLLGKIEDLTVEGEGVAKIDGMPFFIKDTVIGDEVKFVVTKLKKNYGYGRALEIITPSPDRVEPVCEHYKRCGGCTLQTMSYEAELRFKEKKVYNNLLRIGEIPADILDEAMEPILGCEKIYHYRNKAQFPFGTDKDGNPICGFYARRSHEIIANTDCALGMSINKTILETVLEFQKKYDVASYDEGSGKGIIRHVLIRSSKDETEHMVCVVINEDQLPKADVLVESLSSIEGVASISINVNKKNTNVILGDKTVTLWGKDTILDTIEGNDGTVLSFEISPQSFFQVNPTQTGKLYSIAQDYADLKGGESVWDLYCGIGTISLFMAKKAGSVIGVEIVDKAIEDAKENAKRNGLSNTEFLVGKAEEIAPELLKRGDAAHPEVVVVDPPRKGCDEGCLSAILTASPDRVVYVSCDSATLARDVKFLRANGYEIKRFRAVDQFSRGPHTEACVKMVRK